MYLNFHHTTAVHQFTQDVILSIISVGRRQTTDEV